VFAATVKPAVPDPEPLPAVMEIHGVVVLDVHAHPAPAVTLDVGAPPLAGTLAWLSGETVKVHAGSCVTVSDCSPIVTEAVRWAPVFAATSKVTCPEP
jgi:hypothetical protein